MSSLSDKIPEDFCELVDKIINTKIIPVPNSLDTHSYFPKENLKQLGALKLLGIQVPEEYGGYGGTSHHTAYLMDVLTQRCGSTALSVVAHSCLATECILSFGNENQKKKYLPLLSKGEIIGAFALTEPSAGSDTGAISTKAIKKDKGYVLTGSKIFCTNGGNADVLVIFAKTNPEKGKRGISAFIVEKGTSGLVIGKAEDKMGLRGSDTRQIHFDDMLIPKENLIGDIENKGHKQALKTLQSARIGMGAYALGYAKASYKQGLKYGVEKGIERSESFQFTLSEMAMRIEASESLIEWAAGIKESGKDYTYEASVSKLFASETATFCANQALKIMGFAGVSTENPAENAFREVKLAEIGEGTSEIHKLIIAREILVKFRESKKRTD